MPTEAKEWIEWLLKTGLMHGIGLVAIAVAVAILLYGFFWLTVGAVKLVFAGVDWAPKVAKGHLDHLTETRELYREQSETTKGIGATLDTLAAAKTAEDRRVRLALSHMAQAGKEATTCKDVHEHLDAALQELKDR